MISRGQKFRARDTVEVFPFQLDSSRQPIYPLEHYPCYCEAQDGFTCPNCRTPSQPEYGVRNPRTNRVHLVRPGEYIVRHTNGSIEVLSESDLHREYEQLP